MKKKVRFLGLDVHAETIAVDLAGEVRSLGTITHNEEPSRKLAKKLRPVKQLVEVRRPDEPGWSNLCAEIWHTNPG